ncbi:unnamed protein product [Orchesella dallaii]|uniref:Actin n=1 Tax=Orchesella dallaii TaxID=48710 RepID=A0ABP1RAX4_9HEXA
MCDELAPLVIDNGSGITKAGFAGDDVPKITFPTIVGHPKYQFYKDSYVGNDAQSKRGILNLRYPIKHGIITNWHDMENIWQHIFFKELRVVPEDHPVLLTEAPLNPKITGEKTAEIMFEKFKVPALYISYTGALCMYSAGTTTGLAVEIGDGVTYSCPMYEGYVVKDAVIRSDFGGRDVSDYLYEMVRDERGFELGNRSQREIMREMKEKAGFVSQNFELELENDGDLATYELPDGEKITVGKERFRCTEPIFQPSLYGLSSMGIHEMASESIKRCEKEYQEVLSKKVVLCGGTTFLPGMVERFQREVDKLLEYNVKIKAQPDRNVMAWVGGSVLASLSTFQKMWVSKEEYDEHGPAVVRKF